ncbi:MAG: ribonuclease HII [Desulfobulbaceae bacterium]|nr:ribonuclease HII [Desulfobulbaceae bacterium]
MTTDSRAPFFSPSSVINRSDTAAYEKELHASGYSRVAGVDEAGRGPLAGPVVAGCVILPPDCDNHRFQDSKTLTARNREILFAYLKECGAWVGVGIVSAQQIDAINILQASLLAMKLAAEDLARTHRSMSPDYLLVDGKFKVPMELPQLALIKGESKSCSIAAASIVAKVTRDELMARLHTQFPMYNFIKNQGYPTRQHRQAVAEYGPCVHHRRSFKGVREFIGESPDHASSHAQRKLR